MKLFRTMIFDHNKYQNTFVDVSTEAAAHRIYETTVEELMAIVDQQKGSDEEAEYWFYYFHNCLNQVTDYGIKEVEAV